MGKVKMFWGTSYPIDHRMYDTLLDEAGRIFRERITYLKINETRTFEQFYEEVKKKGFHFLPWDEGDRNYLTAKLAVF